MTLNINSLIAKRPWLVNIIKDREIDVVLLQETLHRTLNWGINIPGDESVASPRDKEETTNGIRGMAVYVKRGIHWRIKDMREYSIWIAVSTTNNGPLIIGNCYVPTQVRYRVRRKAIAEINDVANTYRAKGLRVVLAGDFNMHREETANRFSGYWPCNVDGPMYFTHGLTHKHPSDIDHFLLPDDLPHLMGEVKVVSNVNISDHSPLCGVIHLHPQRQSNSAMFRTTSLRPIDRVNIKEVQEYRKHKLFFDLLEEDDNTEIENEQEREQTLTRNKNGLEEEDDDDDEEEDDYEEEQRESNSRRRQREGEEKKLEKLVNGFIKTIQDLRKKQERPKRRCGKTMSWKALKLIKEARTVRRRIMSRIKQGLAVSHRMKKQLKMARVKIKEQLRKDQTKSFMQYLNKGAQLLGDHQHQAL